MSLKQSKEEMKLGRPGRPLGCKCRWLIDGEEGDDVADRSSKDSYVRPGQAGHRKEASAACRAQKQGQADKRLQNRYWDTRSMARR